MKLWTWKYIDLSNPEIPNCNKRWEFSIPYLLKSSRSIFGFDGGFSINIRFLCFGFSFITNCSCGKVRKLYFKKWYITLVLRHGWSCEISIGLNKTNIISWQTKRILKKMTPEEVAYYFRTLKEMLEIK